MFHPFIDVTKLSDEEILDRLKKAYNYLNSQTELGHIPTIQSIKEVINALEVEKNNRSNNIANDKMLESSKTYIEIGKLQN